MSTEGLRKELKRVRAYAVAELAQEDSALATIKELPAYPAAYVHARERTIKELEAAVRHLTAALIDMRETV